MPRPAGHVPARAHLTGDGSTASTTLRGAMSLSESAADRSATKPAEVGKQADDEEPQVAAPTARAAAPTARAGGTRSCCALPGRSGGDHHGQALLQGTQAATRAKENPPVLVATSIRANP